MTSGNGEQIKSILVALDASPQSLAALEAAADLARNLNAELVGMFVEDINLVRLAELPGTHEVGTSSGTARPLETGKLQRQLRARAERARRALAGVAQRSGVRWSFRVARGAIETELLKAANEADLVILGRAGWSGRGRLGSTAQALLSQAPRRALVLEAGEQLQPALMAVFDGSESALRALETAADMAVQRRGVLIVGIVGEDEAQASEHERQANDWLSRRGVDAQIRRLQAADSSELAGLIQAREDCMLVLPGESTMLQDKPLAEALGDFKCPVLVVR